jgi:hypothetical protein
MILNFVDAPSFLKIDGRQLLNGAPQKRLELVLRQLNRMSRAKRERLFDIAREQRAAPQLTSSQRNDPGNLRLVEYVLTYALNLLFDPDFAENLHRSRVQNCRGGMLLRFAVLLD